MVAEIGHPLKISLGHRVHGWKMYHGWAIEVPKSFATDFCEEANNVIFESWWANSWRRGWRCLLSSLPRRLDWALGWLAEAGKRGLVECFGEADLAMIREFYFADANPVSYYFQWCPTTDPLVDINVLSPIEQTIVWQRIHGSSA